MKRISTLVLTACFALAAFALVPQPVEQLQVPQRQQLTAQKATLTKTLNETQSVELRSLADQAAPVVKAPKGEDQTINIEAAIYAVEYNTSISPAGWYIVASDEAEQYQVRFFYPSENTQDPTGTYTTEDFDLNYSFMFDYTSGTRVTVEYETITMTLKGNLQEGYDLTAEFQGSDEKVYKVHAVKEGLPAVKQTIDLVATNLVFDESYISQYKYLFADASNETYAIEVLLVVSQQDYLNAEYSTTAIVVQLTELATEKVIKPDLAYAELTTKKEGKESSLKGYILDVDGIRYNFDLSFTVPEPTVFHNIEFTQLTPIGFYNNYDYQWVAQDVAPAGVAPEGYDIVAIHLDIITTTLAGEYTWEDYYSTYTLMGFIDSKGVNATSYVDIAEVNNTKITYDEATGYHHLTAEIVSTAGVQYNVKMHGLVGLLNYDELEGSVERAFTDDEVTPTFRETDYTASYGFYSEVFQIQTETEMLGLQFLVAAPDKDLHIPAGTYTIGDLSVGNVVASSGYSSQGVTYSFYATINGNYYDKFYFFRSGTVEVKHVDGKLEIAVDARNSAGVPVKITYGPKAPTALDNTSADAPQARKVIAPNGQLQIIRGEHIYDATGAILK